MTNNVKGISLDVFGNVIDQEVGYARGKILQDSFSEKTKQQHAVRCIKEYIETYGEDKLYIFTGNIRDNQLETGDLGIRSEEWVGPSLFQHELKKQC